MYWNSHGNTNRGEKEIEKNENISSMGTLRKGSNYDAYQQAKPAKILSNRPQTQNELSDRRIKTGK